MAKQSDIEKVTAETVENDRKKLKTITEAIMIANGLDLPDGAKKIVQDALVTGHVELIGRKSLQAIITNRKTALESLGKMWEKQPHEKLVERMNQIGEFHRDFYHDACVVENKLRKLKDQGEGASAETIADVHNLMDDLTDLMDGNKDSLANNTGAAE